MKKIIVSVVMLLTMSLCFGETIHLDHAYLMKKDSEGNVYVIRVLDKDNMYHDWYVIATDEPWLFRGYESGDEIIIDKTTDIAIIGY